MSAIIQTSPIEKLSQEPLPAGDATPFTRGGEVEAEWRIITPIEEAWAHLPVPDFPNYAAGSEGPTSWQ